MGPLAEQARLSCCLDLLGYLTLEHGHVLDPEVEVVREEEREVRVETWFKKPVVRLGTTAHV